MESSMPGFTLLHWLPACSCPSSQWCYLNNSASDALFTFCLQSFPASDLFQWVSSSHQMAKVLELQLQHQSSQRIFRAHMRNDLQTSSADTFFFPSSLSLSHTFIIFYTVSQQDSASELSNGYSSYNPLFRERTLKTGKKLIWMNLRFLFWRNVYYVHPLKIKITWWDSLFSWNSLLKKEKLLKIFH